MAVSAETVEKGPEETSSQSGGEAGVEWFRTAIGQAPPEGEPKSPTASSEITDTANTDTETEKVTGEVATEQPGSVTPDSQEQSKAFTVTEEQLEAAFKRRLDSHLQSPEMKRQRQSEIDKAVAQANKSKRRQEVEALRKEYPRQYVEELEVLEAEEKAEKEKESVGRSQFEAAEHGMKSAAALFDTAILGPVLTAIPAPLRAQLNPVYAKNLAPFEERQELVATALKLIRQDAEAKAERSLRNNQAFIKQLLRDNSDNDEELDIAVGQVAPLVSGETEGEFMNNLMRGSAGFSAPKRRK